MLLIELRKAAVDVGYTFCVAFATSPAIDALFGVGGSWDEVDTVLSSAALAGIRAVGPRLLQLGLWIKEKYGSS